MSRKERCPASLPGECGSGRDVKASMPRSIVLAALRGINRGCALAVLAQPRHASLLYRRIRPGEVREQWPWGAWALWRSLGRCYGWPA